MLRHVQYLHGLTIRIREQAHSYRLRVVLQILWPPRNIVGAWLAREGGGTFNILIT